METIEITTPSGYIVAIKASLTYGEYEDIQNAIVGDNVQIDSQGKPIISLKAIREANKKAFELLLIKIEKDGQPFTGTIRDLPAKDGQAIKRKIDEITKEAQPDEKKSE